MSDAGPLRDRGTGQISSNVESRGWNPELEDLSPRSKDTVVQELYGELKPAEVSSVMVAQKLKDLDAILMKIPSDDKRAYLQASANFPEIKSNESLRRKFLEAEQFDVGLAAHRVTQYFEYMVKWFNQGLLGKEIMISDLDEDDLQVLHGPTLQAVKRDEKGRKIFCYCIRAVDFKSSYNVVSMRNSCSIELFPLMLYSLHSELYSD